MNNRANMNKFLIEKLNENNDIPVSEDPSNGNSCDSDAQSNTQSQNVNFDNQNNDFHKRNYNNSDQYIGSTNIYNIESSTMDFDSQTYVFNDPLDINDSFQNYQNLNEQANTFLMPPPLTPPQEHNFNTPTIPSSANSSDNFDSLRSQSSESVTDSHVMDVLNVVLEKRRPNPTNNLTLSNAQNKRQQGYALDQHLPKTCKNCHDGKIREVCIKHKLKKIYDAKKILKDDMAALDARMNKLNQIIEIIEKQQPSPKQSRRNH